MAAMIRTRTRCLASSHGSAPCVPAALLGVTLFNYVMSLVAVALFYSYYTKPDDCTINKFFISFNLCLCLVASVLSVLPRVQVRSLTSVWILLNWFITLWYGL